MRYGNVDFGGPTGPASYPARTASNIAGKRTPCSEVPPLKEMDEASSGVAASNGDSVTCIDAEIVNSAGKVGSVEASGSPVGASGHGRD